MQPLGKAFPLFCILLLCGGCSRQSPRQSYPRAQVHENVNLSQNSQQNTISSDASIVRSTVRECTEAFTRHTLDEGLVLEQWRASEAPLSNDYDRCITVLRADTRYFQPVVLSSARDGGPYTAPQWAQRHSLSAVINASMFREDQRSTGLLIDGSHRFNTHDNPLFGGFLAMFPRNSHQATVGAFGRDCSDFSLPTILQNYRVVIQNYRLLNCDGQAINWQDPKTYSAAAIGVDQQDRLVFIHSRTPYTMAQFARMLSAIRPALRSAHFVEGGPEASLYVHTHNQTHSFIGSFETGFLPNNSNTSFWELPNVLGLRKRSSPTT